MEAISSEIDYFDNIIDWLISNPALYTANTESVKMSGFLKKMDEFDLDDYIRVIHFDELKVPSVPFQLPTTKTYYGVKEMCEGELDFFKSTFLSKSMKPIFMHSDMAMTDMAEDMEFNKKWMFGIAMSIKKGLYINIIHCLDRPFDELMLGLEAWIPIYMTGQISPYHLPDNTSKVYHHLNYVSGTVALCGECIDGFHGDGKYELTNNKEAVAYFQRKAEHVLSKAEPLMNIFDTTRAKEYMKSHTNYTLKVTDITAFRNIQIQILENQYVVVSKAKAPVIHFVIKHPVMVNALQNFDIAVIE